MGKYTAEDIGARFAPNLEEGKDFRYIEDTKGKPIVKTLVEGVDYRFTEDKFRNLDDCIREAKPEDSLGKASHTSKDEPEI